MVVYVHGLNEHAQRLQPHVHRFLQCNVGIFAVDLPGHGTSTSQWLPLGSSAGYGYALSAAIQAGAIASEMTSALDGALDYLAREDTSETVTPLFYLGASFGAALALEAAHSVNAASLELERLRLQHHLGSTPLDSHSPSACESMAAQVCQQGSNHDDSSWGSNRSEQSDEESAYAMGSGTSQPIGNRASLGGYTSSSLSNLSSSQHYSYAMRGLHSTSANHARSSDRGKRHLRGRPARLPHISGVIAQAPLLLPAAASAPRWHHKAALSLLSAIGATHVPLVRGVTGGGRAYHPSIAQTRLVEDARDPLVYRGPINAGTALSLQEAMGRMQARMRSGQPFVPGASLLLQHGTDDAMCDVEGSRQLARAWRQHSHYDDGSDHVRVRLIEYEGGHHDLLRERRHVAEAVMDDAVQWIVTQVEANKESR